VFFIANKKPVIFIYDILDTTTEYYAVKARETLEIILFLANFFPTSAYRFFLSFFKTKNIFNRAFVIKKTIVGTL
jgi:hypothetical protein